MNACLRCLRDGGGLCPRCPLRLNLAASIAARSVAAALATRAGGGSPSVFPGGAAPAEFMVDDVMPLRRDPT